MFQRPIVAAEAPPVTPAAFRQLMAIETGDRYRAFRKTLVPDYRRVHVDIALGYAALAGCLVLIGQAPGIPGGLVAATLGAAAIGFLVAYLQLFIHEAAHFNLAPDKRVNDRIADWLICWQVGTNIAAYRATHAEHHRHLGHGGDTEISYLHALSLRFVIEMLTGIHAIRVFTARTDESGAPKAKAPLLRGIAIHAILLASLVALGAWPAALAWIGGMAIAFPFFATLRQLLEHRPADGLIDTGDAVTRLFGDGAFARVFGGAGFNRHLLHHLEPQLSYTRLIELDRFLAGTSMAPVLDAHRTTYFATCRALLAEPHRG
ncbi:MAG: hypothetical protein B7Y45_00050 [Sphingomonas sp. 28-66-16]|nr:MAG: hypothetical protein B7Y45_00050 [Sphingomonas sp. 28-66-16]